MLRDTILNLFNIVISCIGTTCIEGGYMPQWHVVWSNDCARQSKSSKPWFFGNKYFNLTSNCKMISSSFKSGHGKGSCDVVEDVFKRFLWREQFNAHGEKLQNVEKSMTFLHNHLFNRLETFILAFKNC